MAEPSLVYGAVIS